VLSEFFLGGRPGRARVGVRGLLGIRVLCLGKGGSEGVLAFEVILGIVRAVSVIAISILISDRE
jgi:anaerobic C4-dicarboxylate transporter